MADVRRGPGGRLRGRGDEADPRRGHQPACPSARRSCSPSTTTRASPWPRSARSSGVTESRVCQIHTKAVLQLRSRIAAIRARAGLGRSRSGAPAPPSGLIGPALGPDGPALGRRRTRGAPPSPCRCRARERLRAPSSIRRPRRPRRRHPPGGDRPAGRELRPSGRRRPADRRPPRRALPAAGRRARSSTGSTRPPSRGRPATGASTTTSAPGHGRWWRRPTARSCSPAPVAGALHVTVRHADGLRTIYSFLAAHRACTSASGCAPGEAVGVAGGPVHVGVRTPDGTYLDPEALFAGAIEPHVRLVPGAEDGLDPLAERRSLLDTFLDRGAAALAHLEATGGALAGARRPTTSRSSARWSTPGGRPTRSRTGSTSSATARPPRPSRPRRAGAASWCWSAGSGTQSEGNSAWELDTAVAGLRPGGRRAVLLPGRPGPVRCPPGAGRARGRSGGARRSRPHGADDPGLDGIPVHPYEKVDSQQSVDRSAQRLGDLLAQVAAAEPGVPIDVIAHSQGGVVARLGVVEAGAHGTLPSDGREPGHRRLAPPGGAASPPRSTPSTRPTRGADAARHGPRHGSPRRRRRPPPGGRPSSRRPRHVIDAPARHARSPTGCGSPRSGRRATSIVPGTATDDPQADTHRLIPTDIDPNAHGDLPRTAGGHPGGPPGRRRPRRPPASRCRRRWARSPWPR